MDQRQRSGGPISGLIKGASFTIGLATELRAHNKAKKSNNQSLNRQESQRNASQDETCSQVNGFPPTYDEAMTSKQSLDSKPCLNHEKTTYVDEPTTIHPLPYPVILPQRRPNDKSRGFVRAYAPDLERYKGIDETTFLNFLKQFHKSSQASGWFTVINIAALGAGFAPSAIAMAVTMSVQMAATAGAEAQSRYRTNAYLDKVNKELFHPKGLHCMIMTFKPEASQSAVLSLSSNSDSSAELPTELLSLRSLSRGSSSASMMSHGKFRTSDGVTEGEFAIPQAAHLVYSTLTQSEPSLGTDDDGVRLEKKESSWKSTGKFLADYKDRRAQAKFAATYGHDSKLAVPGATDSARFASRFSDPNVNPLGFMSRGDQYRSGSRDARDQRNGQGRCREANTGLMGGIKKMMQQDLLYLLIAEIPTEEETRNMFQ